MWGLRSAAAVGLAGLAGALSYPGLPARAGPPPPVAVTVFSPGEQLSFEVSYLGLVAGNAQITVGAEVTQWGRRVWPIVCGARSDLGFFPLRDKFVTYWDLERGGSAGAELFADENHHRRKERFKLDHLAHQAHVTKQKEGEERVEKTVEIPEGAMDMAAATFALRDQPLEVKAEFEFPVFTGNRSFTLKAVVLGRQVLETRLGSREVFKIRIETHFAGNFEATGEILAFVSTDSRHLPIRIQALFVLGSLFADLTDFKAGQMLPPGPATPAPAR